MKMSQRRRSKDTFLYLKLLSKVSGQHIKWQSKQIAKVDNIQCNNGVLIQYVDNVQVNFIINF